MKHIVVIGGGTGSFVLLTGLKKLPSVALTAIVPCTDSGGSTGRLKDEFGFLPIGDVRQCLVALAADEKESFMLRELFNYRFEKGENGLKGHSLGNLFLTALTDILGSELEAIAYTQKLMNIQGHVYPVSKEKPQLIAEYENGSTVEGEHNIDEPGYPHDGRLRISKLYTSPKVQTYKEVTEAIQEADVIMLGPGDLYTSTIANLVVGGIKESIGGSKAKIVYTVNLMTKFGQTFGMSAKDHIDEITKYAGREPDYILLNSAPLPKRILKRYVAGNDAPVVDDLRAGSHSKRMIKIIRTDLLANEEVKTPKGDVIRRSLIRHNGDEIAKEVAHILKG